MIPISDANPSLNKPLVTIFFIWVCVFIYIFIAIPGIGSDALAEPRLAHGGHGDRRRAARRS